MFPTLVRRLAERAKPPPAVLLNPYKTKKVWPPDFSKLSPNEEFRFEKRYKRRLALANARPAFHRKIKLAQFLSVTFFIVYGVVFMDWKTEYQPFQRIREEFWALFGTTPQATWDPRHDYKQLEPKNEPNNA